MDRVRALLNEAEFDLWQRLQGRDQRHSVVVWQRFLHRHPRADIHEQRAALLHDIGKVGTTLGPVGRAIATLAGPRTTALRTYLEHEERGMSMLVGVSHPRTVEVLRLGPEDPVVAALRDADDI